MVGIIIIYDRNFMTYNHVTSIVKTIQDYNNLTLLIQAVILNL